MKTEIIRRTLAVCILTAAFCIQAIAGKPVKTLVITGQNNHNWKLSHEVIRQILENSGLFQVDFAISPSRGKDMSDFIIDFTPYKLVVLDYNGDSWCPETKRRFVEYAKNGGGIVIYHAANNSFPDWKEYNEIIGLGGWEGRNEKSGPWVYLKDGVLVKDTSPGDGGSHGNQHEYVLTSRDDKHPINKGLPKQWKHATDELYDRMRGPGNLKSLLFSAYSALETNGSGREEPLIFTVDYGKARIFHTMIGHAGRGSSVGENTAMQCTGFQVTLLRGCEWAATGKVTQKVPDDFPKADQISLRPNYK